MAYLEKTTLTCPNCGAKAPLTWIVGVGPSAPGVAYVSTQPTDDWDIVNEGRGVRVLCKACGSEVAQRSGAPE